MNRQMTCVAVIAAFLLNQAEGFADEINSSLPNELSSKISHLLSEKIPRARIKIPSLDHVASLSPLSDIAVLKEARFMEDKSNGIVVVEVVGLSEGGREIRQIVQTPYEAWLDVPTATRRIFPNTRLKADDFKVQAVNVATGVPREYRGIMVEAHTDFDKMESRQTILENQFVTRTSIQKQPDVRKGEMVKLELISGELSLVTQAIVQEPGAIGERVRVLTLKTKKEIVGKVRTDHSVEVSL